MKRTSLRKIGKIGKANIEANRRIAEYLNENIINRCEMQLKGCMQTWPLQIAHKHKRVFYKGDVEKLSDPNEWVVACQNCHEVTEHNRELNDEVFARLRPE